MYRQEIIPELRNLISDYLKNQGLNLIDLIYRYEGKNLSLRILVDKPESGISLDECAYFNNEISRILDEKNVLQGNYILEVSSPGLDRPLTTRNDFLRCMDRNIKFYLGESVNCKNEIQGVIIKVEPDTVYIDSKGEVIPVALSKIKSAKQVINSI